MMSQVLELALRDRVTRRLEHHLLLPRQMAARDVEEGADLLAQDGGILQTKHGADLLIHELVLVAETFQRAERAGVLLVRLKQRLVLDARMSEEGDGERLRSR